MNICISRVAVVAAIGAMAFSTTPALADSENAAEVEINETSCTGAVPTEEGVISASTLLIGVESRVQLVKTSGGKSFLMCKFDVPAEMTPSSKRSAKGFGCTVDGKRTTDSQMLVSPGGRGMLVCRND